MRQTEDVKAFKNELRNYLYYKKSIDKIDEIIEELYAQLGGRAKAINYDGITCHSPKNIEREYKIRDEIEMWLKKKARNQSKIDEIDKVLAYIEMDEEWLRIATYDMYARSIQSFKLGLRYDYSPSVIKEKIDKAIKKALEKI